MAIRRRDLLTGACVAGGLTLSPLMQGVFAQVKQRVAGSDQRPKRFVFCFKSNGLWAELIQPQGMESRLPFKLDDKWFLSGKDAQARYSLTPAGDVSIPDNVKLHPAMASLEPFADRVSILQGINSGFSSVNHDGYFQTLGAYQSARRFSKEAEGPTVDTMLSRVPHYPVPHLRLGQKDNVSSGLAYLTTSAEDAGKPLAFYVQPSRAYRDLFGVVGKGTAKNVYDSHTDLLDFFVEDTKRIHKEVAGSDREQLDRYLQSFESIRQSRSDLAAMSDVLRRFAPAPPPALESRERAAIAESNTEIAAAALVSGLTNVVTLQFDLFESEGLHSLGHSGQNGRAMREQICKHYFAQVARIAAALQAVPEGDGTMLDNTVIVFTSKNGETHHSKGVNWPMVVIGDLGGKLKRRRYFAPDPMFSSPEERSLAATSYTRLGDVWATLLAAVGMPFEKFGRPVNGVAHKPIESLLA